MTGLNYHIQFLLWRVSSVITSAGCIVKHLALSLSAGCMWEHLALYLTAFLSPPRPPFPIFLTSSHIQYFLPLTLLVLSFSPIFSLLLTNLFSKQFLKPPPANFFLLLLTLEQIFSNIKYPMVCFVWIQQAVKWPHWFARSLPGRLAKNGWRFGVTWRPPMSSNSHY